MQRTVSRTYNTLLIIIYALLGVCSGFVGTSQAAGPALGPCEPGYVRHWQPRLPIMRAAMHREVATPETTVQLEWLGHSSFLMTSPDGLRVLIDPSALYPPSPTPDVVTVSNLHGTHSAVEWVKGSPRVLWGLSLPDARWNRIATTIRDVSLFNIPSYASRTQLEESPVQNSIFVFRTGGFCIVHLGNLRHPLTAQQLQQIGTPDVVMIPVDGQWTMSYTDVISVITQLQPRLVIPMHIDVAPHADVFVRYTQGRYPVRRLAGRTLTLRRSDLPAATEIVMFSDRQD
jgi:L-ascorbate metabolism protein UlaG (beta-lactamase superfamily)